MDMTTASYYPSLGSLCQVKVLDADEPIFASQDLFTFNCELRHFIDQHYLNEYVPGGRDLEIIDPTPPCTTVWMAHTPGGSSVVGMLKHRLQVTCFNPSSHTWHRLKLKNVLVVASMPVPMHVSLKAVVAEAANNEEQKLLYALQGRESMSSPDLFPQRYSNHPYWNGSPDVLVVGSYAFDRDGKNSERMTQHLVDNATGRPNRVSSANACAHCGKLKPPLRCSRCRVETYCDTACQRAHWSHHRANCHPVPSE
jgi:hypothetical protein